MAPNPCPHCTSLSACPVSSVHAGCKCSNPSALRLARLMGFSLPRSVENQERPFQEDIPGTRAPSHLGNHWHSVGQKSLCGLLGSGAGDLGARLIIYFSHQSQPERSTPQPEGQVPSIPHRMLMAPLSPGLCRICSWPHVIPSQATPLEISELQEVSLNGQTLSSSLIKFKTL